MDKTVVSISLLFKPYQIGDVNVETLKGSGETNLSFHYICKSTSVGEDLWLKWFKE